MNKAVGVRVTSPTAVRVGWSELPKDLIHLISEKLDNEFELIRFRSVCSSWRSSSVSYLTNNLPFNFPLKFDSEDHFEDDSNDDSNDDSDDDSDDDPVDDSDGDSVDDNNNNNTNMSFCSFSRRNIFLIKPLQQQQTCRPALIRVTQNLSEKTKLSPSPFLPFHSPCSFSIDLTKFSFHHFGTDFIIGEHLRRHHYIYPRKVVAVTPLILAILLDYDNLVLLRFGDERWTEIPDMPSCIGDICLFKGRIYAVERSSSKTVTVAPEDLSVRLVAKDEHVGWWKMKFLVESEGELLLVDISESLYYDTLTIDVFRLDEKEKEWVKLMSLGDRILFWGNGCSFSASALDLCVTKGNCIIFMEDYILDDSILDDKKCDTGMCVFDIDKDRLLPIRRYPHYFNLFWPAPDWIDINCMRKITKKRALSSYTEAKQRKRT